MKCPVCDRRMDSSIFRDHTPGRLFSEESYACECGYEEIIASDGFHKVVVGGCEFICGDPSTIAGNLTAWQVWYAIMEQKEALRHGR